MSIKAVMNGVALENVTSLPLRNKNGQTIGTVTLEEVSNGGDSGINVYTATRDCTTSGQVWSMLLADGIIDGGYKVISLKNAFSSGGGTLTTGYALAMVTMPQGDYLRLGILSFKASGAAFINLVNTSTSDSSEHTGNCIIHTGDQFIVTQYM